MRPMPPVLALLGSLRAALRTRTDLTLENLALRQQLALLRRRSKRPQFGRLDLTYPPFPSTNYVSPRQRFEYSNRSEQRTVWPLLVVVPPPVLDGRPGVDQVPEPVLVEAFLAEAAVETFDVGVLDRKSTRLNSSHTVISYAVF